MKLTKILSLTAIPLLSQSSCHTAKQSTQTQLTTISRDYNGMRSLYLEDTLFFLGFHPYLGASNTAVPDYSAAVPGYSTAMPGYSLTRPRSVMADTNAAHAVAIIRHARLSDSLQAYAAVVRHDSVHQITATSHTATDDKPPWPWWKKYVYMLFVIITFLVIGVCAGYLLKALRLP